MDDERKIRHAAAKLVSDENYVLVMQHMVSVMSDALLGTDPMNDVALRATALRREAIVSVLGYIQQLAEPIPQPT